MIRSSAELARAEEHAALQQQLQAAHCESVRAQFYALCELYRERTGRTPEELHRDVAERIHRNLASKEPRQ